MSNKECSNCKLGLNAKCPVFYAPLEHCGSNRLLWEAIEPVSEPVKRRTCSTCRYDISNGCDSCYDVIGACTDSDSKWEPVVKDFTEEQLTGTISYGDGEESVDGLKYDVHKTDMTFLADWDLALMEICKLSAFGAKKYERGGWTKIKDPQRLKACMLRHYFKEKYGFEDEDSGVMHDVAVAWNALSALQIRIQNDLE